jgi:hypothetical protein
VSYRNEEADTIPALEPDDTMERLSARLGVMNEQQDWGIVNGSSERYDEFLRMYATADLNPIERSAVAELVLASANERLVQDRAAGLEGLAESLPRNAQHASWDLDYWLHFRAPDGFVYELMQDRSDSPNAPRGADRVADATAEAGQQFARATRA